MLIEPIECCIILAKYSFSYANYYDNFMYECINVMVDRKWINKCLHVLTFDTRINK